jgi:hypothetical protein
VTSKYRVGFPPSAQQGALAEDVQPHGPWPFGVSLLHDPTPNKGTAFTEEEREMLSTWPTYKRLLTITEKPWLDEACKLFLR